MKLLNVLPRAGLFILIAIFSVSLAGAQSNQTGAGQQQQPATANRPEDKPIQVKSDELRRYEEAIKPYVEKAKKSYPDAKKRFLAGLPRGHVFYLTTQLRDKTGRFEQTFIEVREIKDGTVKGIVANDITLVSGYEIGDDYSFPESELLDWTIAGPDGSEEGNFVGKFLDEYQKKQN
jgi:uncharacterized protein YegJ (DUF2314 family)